MRFVIIVSAYILSIYLFYILIKIRRENKKEIPDKVYVLIVCILLLLIVWNLWRVI